MEKIKKEKYLRLVFGVILISLILGSSSYFFREIKKPEEKKEVNLKEQQLTNLRAGVYGFSWSPDGGKIVFVTHSDYDHHKKRSFDIWIMDNDGSNQKRLTGPEGDDSDPSWSPDGKTIVYVSNREGERIKRFGEGEEWDRKSNLWIMDSDGSNQKRLTKPEESAINSSFSSDGKKIVYVSLEDNAIDLCIMDSDGENQRRLIKDLRGKRNPSWSPDGNKIIFEATPLKLEHIGSVGHTLSYDLWIINSDRTNKKPLKKIEENERLFWWSTIKKSSWSPDGNKILFNLCNGPCQVWTMDSNGSNQKKLTESEANARDSSWSPDGKKIVFSLFKNNTNGMNIWSEGETNSDIWIMNSDGSNETQLTTDKMDDFNPSWSPDGKNIAFARGGEIWIITIK
ncbi:PD40 domain-containing protein [Candidatus Parcubacteria bacterium]|nr:PD40 domain-containing protein [Candidatus Parcubacteria bacterium]